MAKTREQKQAIVEQFTHEFENTKSVVFVDYYGLNVGEVDELRKLLKEKACKYIVGKKTLLKRSLDSADLKNIDIDSMQGGLGVVFGRDDEMAPANVVSQFMKKHKQMKIHGGVFNTEFIDANTVKILAELPSLQELRAHVVGVIKAPVNNFVSVLNGNIRGLVYVLANISKA
ncbi:50S ribosomal protein L10 [Patescibacteria group bacterium AH-259-L05]|nr:50S ribosomal protein L10 [Patescibacteria group bacterium AH-259-L05]